MGDRPKPQRAPARKTQLRPHRPRSPGCVVRAWATQPPPMAKVCALAGDMSRALSDASTSTGASSHAGPESTVGKSVTPAAAIRCASPPRAASSNAEAAVVSRAARMAVSVSSPATAEAATSGAFAAVLAHSPVGAGGAPPSVLPTPTVGRSDPQTRCGGGGAQTADPTSPSRSCGERGRVMRGQRTA